MLAPRPGLSVAGFDRLGKNIPERVRITDEHELRGNGRSGSLDPEVANPKDSIENILVSRIISDLREGNDDLALVQNSLSIHQPIRADFERFCKVRDESEVHQRPPAYDRFESLHGYLSFPAISI